MGKINCWISLLPHLRKDFTFFKIPSWYSCNGDSSFIHTRKLGPCFCFITCYFYVKRSIKTKQHFAGTQTVRMFLMACCLSQTNCCWLTLLFAILICCIYRESCLQISTFTAQTKTLKNVPLGYEPVSLQKMCWLTLSVTVSVTGILHIFSPKKEKKEKILQPIKTKWMLLPWYN